MAGVGDQNRADAGRVAHPSDQHGRVGLELGFVADDGPSVEELVAIDRQCAASHAPGEHGLGGVGERGLGRLGRAQADQFQVLVGGTTFGGFGCDRAGCLGGVSVRGVQQELVGAQTARLLNALAHLTLGGRVGPLADVEADDEESLVAGDDGQRGRGERAVHTRCRGVGGGSP